MYRRFPGDWMWAEACAWLEKKDQVARQSFRAPPGEPSQWEPPVDVLEVADLSAVIVALPGVPAESVEVELQSPLLRIRGRRPVHAYRQAQIRRLEIPYGVFERLVELPPGEYQLVDQSLQNGLLELRFRRFGAKP